MADQASIDLDITVVIPVWGEYAGFLPECVASVQEDGPGIRILVVDNASEPALPEADGYAVIRSGERLTVGAARNFGLAAVETPYALILDADDRLLPGTLAKLHTVMEEESSVAFCSTLIQDGRTGTRHPNPRPFVRNLTRWPAGFAFLECVWSFVPIQGCALLRTDQVLACGGYPDADWGDDWVLAMSLAFRGQVRILPHLGRYYRATAVSLRTARGTQDDLASASLVRRRIVEDPGIGSAIVSALPLIWLLQMIIALIARPALRLARRLVFRG